MTFRPLLVWCDLAGGVAGEPPMLDGLLVNRAAILTGAWRHLSRDSTSPPLDGVRIPVGRTIVGGWPVYHVSSPIFALPAWDVVEYYHRKFPVDLANMLACDERTQVPTTMTWTKSYRLPNRVRGLRRVCWIVEGDRREIIKLLKHQPAIGKDVGMGYGPVARLREGVYAWGCEESPGLTEQWWFGRHDAGPVLMRPLPLGDWLPRGLLGARRDFGACCPPYWHHDRFAEIVVPCP